MAQNDSYQKKFSVTSLGSGSKGNATLVRYDESLLLIDNGFSCKELVSRMSERHVDPNDVSAILVTHEHSDHIKGVPAFSKKFSVPVWMSSGTSLHKNAENLNELNLFNSHQDFSIGDITVCPVSVPHDSREACQFVLKHEHKKIGVLTDIGHITPYVIEQYQDCDILLLEFNHDRELLLNSHYPASLKARVTGSLGHLSNQQAANFLNKKITNKLQYLIAMHLSEENNSVEIVRQCISNTELKPSTQVKIAGQANGFDWISVN